ncbi:MAG: hypothetical protein EA376_04045 [Phycisphaeraceae bacterium]|nr:MAG: hypothetical protein EA376_04045 [Phycisphaeraceae bacterium]
MGVFVASFAGTTMDTACRLQRYVIQELARTFLPRAPRRACPTCGYDVSGLSVAGKELESPHSHHEESTHAHTPIGHERDAEAEPGPAGEASGAAAADPQCPECGTICPLEQTEATAWRATLRAQRALASNLNPFKWLATVHGATLFAVATAAMLAAVPPPGQALSWQNAGMGGLILWPLFGATNQLLAGLAFIVIAAWLIAKKRPWWFIVAPTIIMIVLPAWALSWQAFVGNEANPSWLADAKWPLVAIAVIVLALEAWLVVEVGVRMVRKDSAPLEQSEQDR